MTYCFFVSLKMLAMPEEGPRSRPPLNVLSAYSLWPVFRCPRMAGRSQPVDATARLNISEGFIHPSVCRGRALSCLAAAARSARV